MDDLVTSDRFPRAAKYNPEWIKSSVSGGAHSLWLAEWLAEEMDLQPGMRVLDLGCGRAASSIFLHREFGVQVWATDLWINVSENWQRIRDAGVADGVMPIHADARRLPFAHEFFDAVVSIDSYFYFGTDDHYLGYLCQFLKPDGQLGIAGAGMTCEIVGPLPDHLREWWEPELWSLHSAQWWRRHWEKTGIIEVATADALPDGWKYWLDWHRAIAPDNAVEIAALEADHGEWLGYARVVGRRVPGAPLTTHVESVPTEYEAAPLLRDESV